MIRFPTEAANADVLGDDTPLAQEPPGVVSRSIQQSRPRTDRPEHRRGRAGACPDNAGQPGKDINAPGFIKDDDAGKPS